MTRREEIELAWLSKAVQSNHRYDEKSFKEAVEWADRTMIEKAVKWLKKYTYQDCLGVSPIARLKVGFSSVEELIEDFRKTMEE